MVFGYVGNKCATLPLQLLGFDVCPVNSVQFSNHTGYGSWSGSVLLGADLHGLVQALSDKHLLACSHVLTGYIGSVSFCEAIVDALDSVCATNPQAQYVCDPVLGDDGKLYVPKELVEVYKTKLVPRATILTPNLFEIEYVSCPARSSRSSGRHAIYAQCVQQARQCRPLGYAVADVSRLGWPCAVEATALRCSPPALALHLAHLHCAGYTLTGSSRVLPSRTWTSALRDCRP